MSALWLLGAKIVAFIINAALPLFIVRRLSQVEFGHYRQAFLILNSANVLLSFGFAMSAFYFFPREPERRGQVVLNIVLFCGTMGSLASLVLLFAPGVLSFLSGDPAMTGLAPLLALLIPLYLVAVLLETFPVVHQEFKVATQLIVLSQLSRTVLLFFAALIFGTVRALLWATVIQVVLQASVLFWYLETRLPGFWRRIDLPLLRGQLVYAMPLGYSGLIWAFQNDLHNYFVSHDYGPAEFAIYSVGCLQVPLMAVLSEAASSVMIGRVSELEMVDDRQEILALTSRVMRKLAAVVFAVYAFLIVMGREFLTLLFTKRYLASWPIFAINISLLLLIPLITDPIVRCYPKHQGFIVKLRTVLFVLMVAALWFVTPRFGPLGAITVAVVTNFIDRLAIAGHFAPIIGLRWSTIGTFRDSGKIAVAAATAGLLTALLRQAFTGSPPLLALLACGAFFVGCYGVMIVLLRIPTGDEWRLLFRYLPVLKPLLPRKA